jgi:hypothetical protein
MNSPETTILKCYHRIVSGGDEGSRCVDIPLAEDATTDHAAQNSRSKPYRAIFRVNERRL